MVYCIYTIYHSLYSERGIAFMGRPSKKQKLLDLRETIESMLSHHHKSIFSIKDLGDILNEFKTSNYETLGSYADGIYRKYFVDFLITEHIVEEKTIKLPKRTMTKYIFKDATKYEIALSINPGSYISHYTAVFLHGLTDNVPKTIYTNTEQYKKSLPSPLTLEQVNIDRAFSRPMRKTNNIAKLEDFQVILLNGKNVNRLEVLDFSLKKDARERIIPMTSLERTLIDIVTRPDYGGGILEILNAYKEAKNKVSAGRLLSILKKFNYTYPYHQSIGFLLDKAGYSESTLMRFDKIEKHNDFYLDYQIKERAYSTRWKIYYPTYLDD